MKKTILHSFNEDQTQLYKNKTLIENHFIIAAIIGVFLGSLTGIALAYSQNNKNKASVSFSTNTKKVKQTAGIKNSKLFPDSTEGILKEGGIDGEGSFHLERPGGKDQYVYLTSTTIDLSQFVGKKVKVWGKTYKAEKAGWLMDVGYLEVLK